MSGTILRGQNMQVANSTLREAASTNDLLRKPPISTGGANSLTPHGVRLEADSPGEAEKVSSVSARPDQGGGKAVESESTADTIAQINDYLQSHGRNLKFKIDKDTGRTVVQVIDSATDEVLRQIPPQEILDIAKRLGDVEGLLFRGDA